MEKRKAKKVTPLKVIVFTVLILYSLSMIAILVWGALTSFKSQIDFADFKNHFGLPNPKYSSEALKFGNYLSVGDNLTYSVSGSSYYSLFGERSIATYTTNLFSSLVTTFYYSVILSFVQAFVCMSMGYMTAKYKNKISNLIVGIVFVLMALPVVGSQPSEISLLMDLGVYNTYFGMFIHKFNYGGIYFLVFNAFFTSISDTYIEAAEIDGASQFRVFISIVVPLAAKMLGMVYLIYFIAAWNDYNTIVLYYPSFPTLSYSVWKMSTMPSKGAERTGAPATFAAAMVLVIPILIVFILFRDLIMGNVSTGGVKE